MRVFSQACARNRRHTVAVCRQMQAHRARPRTANIEGRSPGERSAAMDPFRRPILFGLWTIMLWSSPVLAQSAEKNTWQTLNFLVENDSFLNNSDKHYTSGLYLSWTSGELPSCNWCTSWARFLMLPTEETATFRNGYYLAQSIFTPSVISSIRPNPRERPFAGWSSLGTRLTRESDHVFDRISGALGIVGPWSGADATQRW